MRTLLSGLAALILCPAEASGQESPFNPGRSVEEERHPKYRVERDRPPAPSETNSGDLWYAVPGVRPGGDLFGPVRDLILHPRELLDFGARRVPSYLPDRETAEFLRDRR
jgi:hypothetical protein